MKKLSVIFITIFIFNLSSAFSQNNNSNANLKGRHSLNLNTGFMTNSGSTASVDLFNYNSRNNNYYNTDANIGFGGSFAYGYWFDDEWSLNFECGVLGADVNSNLSTASTFTVVPILFGMKYYPSMLTMGSVGRVYAGLSMGIYTGTSVNSTYWVFDQVSTEHVFGAKPEVGVDLFVANWFKIGPNLSYHIMSEFTKISNENKNQSGLQFSLNMGIVL